MNSKWSFFVVVSCVVGFTSCSPPRKVTYVQDMLPSMIYPMDLPNKEIKLTKDDKLSITVGSKNPELVIPFNIGVGSYALNADGAVASAMSGTTSIRERGYVLDKNGEIEFPIIGKIKAEGLTTKELGDVIKNSLIKNGLVSDPMVTVDLLNLKITVLGEVGSVGVQTIQDTRVTLLDVIANSGGVTSNGRMDNVAVIREEDGVRQMYETNLKSMELFESPAFYLQQNDIVYVRPIAAKPSARTDSNWRMVSAGLTIISLVSTLLLWLK